jgi:hypothetical protein
MRENPYQPPKVDPLYIRKVRMIGGFAALPAFLLLAWLCWSSGMPMWILPAVFGSLFAAIACRDAYVLLTT